MKKELLNEIAILVLMLVLAISAYKIGHDDGYQDGYHYGVEKECEFVETQIKSELEWLSEEDWHTYLWTFDDGSRYHLKAAKAE